MQQKKLETFFKIVINHDQRVNKCFIYDPDNYKAFFVSNPIDTDKYIVNKLGIKLYYRSSSKTKVILLPELRGLNDYSVPLLKSNLQKAIRRCENEIAIKTCLAILQKEPLELLRRLPIIYIEDVCLMDSYTIIVWLMMADKDYEKLTNVDIDIILNIVNSLCNCRDCFHYIKNDKCYHYSHELLKKNDQLLAVYYRSEYGGMKGDIQMLKVAIDYYISNPCEIKQTQFNSIDYSSINGEIEILAEAVDFHPLPQMLTILNKLTHIDRDTIKMCIWFAESGYNIRKLETIETSKIYKERNDWKKIETYLDDVRSELINRYIA